MAQTASPPLTSSAPAGAPTSAPRMMFGLTPDEWSEAIFGTFAGMTSLLGVIASALITLPMAVGIAQARVAKHGVVRVYVQTFAILLVAGGLSVLVSMVLGATG